MTIVNRFRTSAFCLVPCALSLVLSTSCGYALAGRGSFLPDYIKIIGIPQFVNQTVVFDLDRVVTQQVQREFSSHGHYKVTPDTTGVDAILTATLKYSALTPATFSTTGQATRYAMIITAAVEFKDVKTDKVLWANPALQFREEYDIPPSQAAGVVDTAAYFNQNQPALERLAQSFARSIVTAILEAF
jgi:Lipopolysaccharide-assembly